MSIGGNPYSPGAGLQPPYLAGRREALRKLSLAKGQITEGRGASPIVITGLRGMGKTVLLGHMRDELRQEGWLAPPIGRFRDQVKLSTVWNQMRKELIREQPYELIARDRHWSMNQIDWKAGAEIGSEGAKAMAELGGSVVRKDTRDLAREAILEGAITLARTASDRGVFIALMFDEAQEAAIKDLAVLAELGQQAGENRWPVLLLFAGLTTLRNNLSKAATFATRFPSVWAKPLFPEHAEGALRIPADERQVTWDDDALEEAVAWAAGIPYHLQAIGQAAWENQDGRQISAEAVREAMPAATQELEDGMYKPLWDRASEREQEYLLAMTNADPKGEGYSWASVLELMGKKHAEASQPRQRLIDKGLIHAAGQGVVAFSYPGFDTYAAKQAAP